MLISIIIPAFNVELYIERCLLSLDMQDIPKEDYEIIVVNDGSPDNLAEIVKKNQEKIPNLILINQANQGVSGARNNAINIAKGKYILPIDPDDYLKENCFKGILEKVEKFNADIVFLKYEKITDSGKVIWEPDFSNYEETIHSTLNSFFVTKGENNVLSDPDRSWAILYKREIVSKMVEPYPLKVPFLEDAIFLVKYLCYTNSIAFISNEFYKRTIRVGSATNSNLMYSEKSRIGFEIGFKHLISFKELVGTLILPEDRRLYLNQVIIKFMVLHLRNELQAGDRKAFENTLKNYNFKSQDLNLYGVRYPFNLLGSSIKYFPAFFPFVMKNIGRVNFLITKLFS